MRTRWPGRIWRSLVGGVVMAVSAARGLAAEPASPAPGALAVLTNAAQVLRLGVEGAQRAPHPVMLTGVVTCPLNSHQWLYLQDATAGMLVVHTNRQFVAQTGQVVRVSGTVIPGQFAAHVNAQEIEVLAQGPLPEPKRADPARMAEGEDFGSWVVVDGRVVDWFPLGKGTVLHLAVGGRRVTVLGPTRDSGALPGLRSPPPDWLDARVEVRGVCWTLMDTWNRPMGFRLHAPGPDCIRVIEPGRADPFDRGAVPVGSLKPGRVPASPRVRVRGTLTHTVPGPWLFLQDGSGAVRAQILPVLGPADGQGRYRDRSHQQPVKPGDVVEVVGHAVRSGAATILTDAEYRVVESGGAVAPTEVSLSTLTTGALDGWLVTVRAAVAERRTRVWGGGVEEVLRLGSDEGRVQAVLRVSRTNTLPALPPGTLVRLSGVCLTSAGELGGSAMSQLLLRGPEDLSVIRPPRAWETLAPGRILLVSGGLGLVALAWIGLLSRQVRQRRRAEERLRRSEAATRIVSYFATSLLERHEEEGILWDLAKNCVARLGFVDCVVYLLDRERGVLVQKAAHGPKNPEPGRILNPLVIPLGRGIVGSVAVSGRAEVIPDTRQDPRYVVDDAFRLSEIAVPIVAGGEVLGVIDSEHPEAGFFTEEHRELLVSIASLCANKLVRVRTERRLRELNLELERRIEQRTAELVEANRQLRDGLDEKARAERVQKALFEISEAVPAAPDLPALYARIHATIATLMHADSFYLALLDPVTGTVSFPYHRDLVDPPPPPRRGGRGMTEYVLRTGRPTLADLTEIQRLKDAGEYTQSGHPSAIWLGVPLTLNGHTFGVMAVQDQHDPKAFGPEDKRLLSFVAGQTALAIERKRQEEELQASTRRLRESEERFGKAFRSTPAVLSIVRLADERLIEVNEAFLSASGFTREEVVGRTTVELGLWVDAGERERFVGRARTEGAVRSFEARLRTKPGAEETVLMSSEAIELNGEPCILVLTIVVTARKRAEEELLRTLAQERELSELKSRFVSMVSHEFRTPLGIILSSAEILESYLDRLPSARRREHLQDIQQATRQMAGLMEEVLVISRAEAGQLEFRPEPLDLAACCHRIADEVGSATQGRCRLELEVAPGLPGAHADASLLRHILTNLLTNAVKYSPAGAVVNLSLQPRDGGAELCVRDHGIGIPEADTRRMFQAFHRGRNVGDTPGSGLGLMIVQRCVELHHGRVRFETREGEGTTFTVWLPVFPVPPVDPAPAPLPVPP